MMHMRKVSIAVIGAAALFVVAACAGTDPMMDEKMDAGMRQDKPMNGMLTGSDGHHASGKVMFGMQMGKTELILSDIKVDKVPDGYVYLTKKADRMHGVELGPLKQFSGTVSFGLPAGVAPEDYDSVVIWCKKFNVEIGRAYFAKPMM